MKKDNNIRLSIQHFMEKYKESVEISRVNDILEKVKPFLLTLYSTKNATSGKVIIEIAPDTVVVTSETKTIQIV